MKEVMIEEARQSNVDLTPDDIKKIEEKLEQSSQTSEVYGNGNDKTNNGNGNGGNNNNGNKGSSGDKGNNGSKG